MPRWLTWLLHGVVLAGVTIAAVRYLEGDTLIRGLRTFDLRLLPLIAGLSLGYLAIKAVRFVLLMRPVTDLDAGTIARAYVAGQAATLVPGGVAARAGLLAQAGVPVERSAGPVLINSTLDQVALLVIAIFAALFYPSARWPVAALGAVAVALAALVALPASRGWFVGAVGRVLDRFGAGDGWRDAVSAAARVVTPATIAWTLLLTLVAFAARLGALWVSLRGVGAEPGLLAVFLAFSLPTMLGRLSGLPAGIGVQEAGIVSFLQAAAGTTAGLAAAAAAIYRVGTDLVNALVGGVVYLLFWDGEDEGGDLPDGEGGGDLPGGDRDDDPAGGAGGGGRSASGTGAAEAAS